MEVLITRALEDGLEFQKDLSAKSILSHVLPLHHIEHLNVALEGEFQALILTSKQGASALKNYPHLSSLPVYCVGDETARVATESGFKNTHSAHGDVHDLVDLIVKECVKGMRFLYLSGEDVRHDLVQILRDQGFLCDQKVVYKIYDCIDLSPDEQALLHSKQITHIPLFSPKSAERLVRCMKAYRVDCASKICVCLSEDIATVAKDVKWHTIDVVLHPSRESMTEYFNGRSQNK